MKNSQKSDQPSIATPQNIQKKQQTKQQTNINTVIQIIIYIVLVAAIAFMLYKYFNHDNDDDIYSTIKF
jgi:magnesium-transporting ATPase (P-type)